MQLREPRDEFIDRQSEMTGDFVGLAKSQPDEAGPAAAKAAALAKVGRAHIGHRVI